jgi:hypothetical protein
MDLKFIIVMIMQIELQLTKMNWIQASIIFGPMIIATIAYLTGNL